MMGMADHVERGSLEAKPNITEAQRCTGTGGQSANSKSIAARGGKVHAGQDIRRPKIPRNRSFSL
jgi:hypothetical protein